MTATTSYRWPTKLRRYGITDPFLKVLVAKYENEIPWQVAVRDQATLLRHVREQMLPRVLARVAYPPSAGVPHLYVTRKHVDLDLALNTDPDLDDIDIAELERIRTQDGEAAAEHALLELVNGRKADAFGRWRDLVGSHHADQPAFAVLLLRPLFELSPAGSRRTVVPPSLEAVDWLHQRIADGQLSPDENIGRTYCLRLAFGRHHVVQNGWQFIPQGRENSARLAAACRGSGWCVSDERFAASYLRHSAFYILRHAGHPVAALRVKEGRIAMEIQGRNNQSPHGWFPDIDLFLRTLKLIRTTHRHGEMIAARRAEGRLDAKPVKWWRDRARFWPFAVLQAPPAICTRLSAELRTVALAYADFPAFPALVQRADILFSEDEWRQYVEEYPERYAQCPGAVRRAESVRLACSRASIERAKAGALTPLEMAEVPDFVLADEEYRTACLATCRLLAGRMPLRAWHIERVPDFVRNDETFRAACLATWMARAQTGLPITLGPGLVPDFVATNQDFRGACLTGWISGVASGTLRPSTMTKAPDFVVSSKRFREACIAAWTEAAKTGALQLDEMQSAPDFVAQSDDYRNALRTRLPDAVRERIRRAPRERGRRTAKFELPDVLPMASDDLPGLAVEHLVNVLLNNEDGSLCDPKFPETIRLRPDFASLRESAWREAMLAHPPLWFALPSDLAVQTAFWPIEEPIGKIRMDYWVDRVRAKPWLLTHTQAVPKRVRNARCVLEAYREGWMSHLREVPWRIWITPPGKAKAERAYMSYALLYDHQVLAAMSAGWRMHEEHFPDSWRQASHRMRNLPAVQVSVLRTIFRNARSVPLKGSLVAAEIAHVRRRRRGVTLPETPVDAEIRSLLSQAGFP